MWRWLLAMTWLSTPARADDVDKARIRLERQTSRYEERRTATEERLASVCRMQSVDPEDPRTLRSVDKAESALITARAREIGCSSRLDAWERPEGSVEVLYATNRAQGETEDGEWIYTPHDADRIEYGRATVTIPARHPAGALDRGLQVTAVVPLTEAEFTLAVRTSLAAAGPDAELLAYVHGFNNSFVYSARRIAQMTYDLDRPIVPVLFSWPSSGGTWFSGVKYTFDENAAARSSAPFADVLGGLLATTEAPVTVVAHSMGSRVVAEAVGDLVRSDRLARPLADVVFAAPDIDVSVFARRYLDTTLVAARRLTVYCAADDRALTLSRSVHGGYDRLGSCSNAATDLLSREEIEIVDASKLWVTFVDHDKVSSSPRLLADLRQLVDGVPAGSPTRGLVTEADRFVLPP